MFSLSAVSVLIAWAGNSYFENKILEIRTDDLIRDGVVNPHVISNKLRDLEIVAHSYAVRQKIAQERDPPMPEGFVLVRPTELQAIGHNTIRDPAELHRVIAATAEFASRYKDRVSDFAGIGLLGGFLAGAFLIWNILCHTVHWVWMGRERPKRQ